MLVLAGCGSSSKTADSNAPPTTTTTTTSQSASETPLPSETPSSAPVVAGGTATDYCGAFKELQAVNDAPSSDPAAAGAKMQAAAADMRKFAPSEIAAAARTYADVMDNIGKAAASGSFDEAQLQQAIADGMAGKAQDISTVAVWAAKNCDL